MFVLNAYFCRESRFVAILRSKLRFLLRNTGVDSDFTQNFWGKNWRLKALVLSSCSMNQWSFFEMLHTETRRSHLYAQSTILTNFVQMKKLSFCWKRARFLSQVLVHCTQYPSLCSFTRALLSTSAISGLCASSFQQFILLCPSWQKVKDLFENKKCKLSSFWEMSFKVFWEYWRWEKES